jgi:lysyl-tRNA synthetase class I
MEQRREHRHDERLVVTIDGRDKAGQCFTEQVVATGISRSGALLSGISRQVRSGDIIWVEHRGRKSRFKVVWVRDSESLQLIQAAIHLLERERCPWQDN